jgi:hypothetical protein
MPLALHLKLVVIDLEPGDNAQAIFEALNDRGASLCVNKVQTIVLIREELAKRTL